MGTIFDPGLHSREYEMNVWNSYIFAAEQKNILKQMKTIAVM